MSELPQALETVVRHLAAPPDEQIEYLAGLGTQGNADELALEFDDAYRPVRAQLPLDLSRGLDYLDGLLGRFSGQSNSEEWTVEALSRSSRWAEVREAARTILGDDI
jgi:hypothetical protein